MHDEIVREVLQVTLRRTHFKASETGKETFLRLKMKANNPW